MRLPRFRLTMRRLLVVVTMMVVSTALIVWKPFIIAYHERKMASDWRTVNRIGASDQRQGDFILSMENHRDALVRLHHLERRVIRLNHMKSSSKEYKSLFLALNQRAAGSPVVEMSWDKTPETVTVWAKPEEISSWDSIVAKYDRSPPESP